MNKKFQGKIKYFLLPMAIFFIGLGIIREEYVTVLKKAIVVCLECIGVG